MEMEMGFIVAQGPQGLEQVLNELLEKSKSDATFKEQPHYVLYELGNQKSLIKMDLNEKPVMFWHYDLLGRAATSVVKDVLARFAWERCGEKEMYLKEQGANNDGAAFDDWREKVFDGKYLGD